MSSEETKVAVMQEQIVYIKKQVDTILATLEKNVQAHQEQIARMQVEIDKRFEGVHNRIDTKADKVEVEKKADKEDLEKIASLLTWINRIVLTAVIGAILALVITQK